jgi:hypothetical protein
VGTMSSARTAVRALAQVSHRCDQCRRGAMIGAAYRTTAVPQG